jgi:rubrerythrin
MDDFKYILETLLTEYRSLEKEYEQLENQKTSLMMPIINDMFMSRSNEEDIAALKNVVSSLKSNYFKLIEESKKLKEENNRLKDQVSHLSISGKITEKQLDYFMHKNLVVTKNYYSCEECDHSWTYVRAERQTSDCPICRKRHLYPLKRKILTY